jgi:hypothetical protein
MDKNVFINVLAGKNYRVVLYENKDDIRRGIPLRILLEWVTYNDAINYYVNSQGWLNYTFLQKYNTNGWELIAW